MVADLIERIIPRFLVITILTLSYNFFNDDLQDGDRFDAPLQELIDTLLKYFNWFNYENQDDYMDYDKLNSLGIKKAIVEFLRVNTWIKKWFKTDVCILEK